MIILDAIKEKYESDLLIESNLLFKSQKSYILDRTKENSIDREKMLFDTEEKLNIIVENLKNTNIKNIKNPLEKINNLALEISLMAEKDEVNSYIQIDRAENIIKYKNIYCDAQILRIIILKNSFNLFDMRLTYSIFVDCIFVIDALKKMIHR
jgi:predicted transcriptional regulator